MLSRKLISLTALLLPINYAYSQDSNAYFGIGLPITQVTDFEVFDISLDEDLFDDAVGFSIYGGGFVTENIGYEITFTKTPEIVFDNDVDLELDQLEISAIFKVPFTQQTSAYGKLGMQYWKLESEFDDDSGGDPTFGAGIIMGIGDEGTALRIGVQSSHLDEGDYEITLLQYHIAAHFPFDDKMSKGRRGKRSKRY